MDDVLYGVDFIDSPTWQPDAYYLSIPAGSSMMTRNPEAVVTRPPYDDGAPFLLNKWRPWRVRTKGEAMIEIGGIRTSHHRPPDRAIGIDRKDFTGFVVTTDDGTRYVFGHPTLATYEYQSPTLSGYSTDYYVSTWRLVAILGSDYVGDEIPYGDESGNWILFHYTEPVTVVRNDGRVPPFIAQAARLDYVVTPTHVAHFVVGGRGNENFELYDQGLYSALERIDLYSRAELGFLEEMPWNAEGGFPTAANTPVQRVVLTQEEGLSSTQSPRLRLDKIETYGRDPNTGQLVPLPSYRFAYYESVGAVESHTQDDFGYFDQQGTHPLDRGDGGKAWSLKRITYPTGGFEEFFYETDEVVAGETARYDVYDIDDNSERTSGYSFDSRGRRQGGARVTRIIRNDGMGLPTSSTLTRFFYGPGHATGVPPQSWRHFECSGAYHIQNERGRVAVYYEWVLRVNDDGSSALTRYSNPNSHTVISRIETLAYKRSGCTIVQGNQDWNWGIPLGTTYDAPDSGGIADENPNAPPTYSDPPVRRTSTQIDITSWPLAKGYSFSPDGGPGGPHDQFVDIVWGFADRVEQTQTMEWGEYTASGSGGPGGTTGTASVQQEPGSGGGTSSSPVTRLITYTHDPHTGLVTESTEYLTGGRLLKRRYHYGYTLCPGPEATCTNHEYTEFRNRNNLSAVVQEDLIEVAGGSTRYLASTATVWKRAPIEYNVPPDEPGGPALVFWKPVQVLAWNPASGSGTPTFNGWNAGTYDCTSPAGASYPDWQTVRRIGDFNENGFPGCDLDARGTKTTVTYDNAGRPERITKADLTRSFTYEPRFGLPASSTDVNNNVTRFTYDAHGRLKTVRDRFGREIASHDYDLPRNADGTINPATPSSVRSRTNDGANDGTQVSEAITYYDGLGRALQTQVDEGMPEGDTRHSYVVKATQYDDMGRVRRQWQPYRYSAHSPSFRTDHRPPSVVTDPCGSDELRPYACVEMRYKNDGLGRPAEVIPEHRTGESVFSARTWYQVGTFTLANGSTSDLHSYVETKDESGDPKKEYYDNQGNLVAVVADDRNGTGIGATTYFTYDAQKRLREVVAPNGTRTTYEYDRLGRLTSRTSSDAGTTRFKYNRAGDLRFSQDAGQAGAGKVLFTTYDHYGRPRVSGEATASFASLDGDRHETFEDDPGNWFEVSHYGDDPQGPLPDTSLPPWQGFEAEIGNAPAPLLKNGHLTARAFKSAGRWQITLDDFDAEARIVQRIVLTDTTPIDPSIGGPPVVHQGQ